MTHLTSGQALQLAAEFAVAAQHMRDRSLESRANVCDIASRVALLKAQIIGRTERARPRFGETFSHTMFAGA